MLSLLFLPLKVEKHWPVIEDPANYTYIRPEGEGLMVGLFEAEVHMWLTEAGVRDLTGDLKLL